MGKETLTGPNTGALGERFASVEEVKHAILALSSADLRRLKTYAWFRVRSSSDPDWEGLFQEAITQTLAGASALEDDEASERRSTAKTGERRWKINLPFVVFLMKVMRSLSSNQRQKTERRGGAAAPFKEEFLAAKAIRAAADRGRCDDLLALFEFDEPAQKVIEGLRMGLTQEEIQRLLLGTSQEAPKCNTVMTRIRRTIRRQMKGDTHHG